MQKLTWFKATIFSGRIDCVYVSYPSLLDLSSLSGFWKREKDRLQEKMEMHRMTYQSFQNKQIGEATLC